MLGEIHRRAEVRRAVQPVDEAVDDGLREQLEIADAREDLRVDEPGAGERMLFHYLVRMGPHPHARAVADAPDLDTFIDLLRCYMPDLGVGTASSS